MTLSARKSLSRTKATFIRLLCIGLFISPVLALAQNWMPLTNGVNSTVRTLYNDTSNNLLYVGGSFLSADGLTANGIATWNGAIWDTLGTGIGGGASPVVSICSYNGELYASTYSSQSFYKWDGISWQVIQCNGPVLQLYLHNTDLYAVGWFDTIGGVPASKVAKYDGSTWSAIDTTQWLSGAINCVTIYNNELYIGGNMVNYNGSMSRIAKWNGTIWQPLGTGISGSLEEVHCFEIFNNNLYVGGYFNSSNGNPGNCVAKWDGMQWSDVGGGMTGLATVRSLKVFNGELFAGGAFITAGGVPIYFLAKWDGINWCGLGISYDSTSSGIYAMDVFNGELYIGGNFVTINSDTMNYISKWIGGNFVDTCGNTTSVEENKKNTTIIVYPNPTHDILNIDISEINNNQTTVEIYNMLGDKIYSENFSSERGQINISSFTSGIYMLFINNNEKTYSKKIIKH
jgi:hypothetical protein